MIAGVYLLISGCAAVNSAVGGLFNADTDLTLTFKVAADINPDESRKPSPLFIRLYELKSTKMFNQVNFIDLYERDKEVLGEDMIAVQKLKRIRPGEDREDHLVLDEKTKFVGLYAEFLNYKNAKYKLVIPVVQHDFIGTTKTIYISRNIISIKD
ncbi:MAG: type VI secretion system lipoprotein TssJ [Gammaproteobacteria bacterium]|nr:type VI secretion system lipoprotein TssJ [Gammaproteobacteria bacterium]MDH5652768.1 type VI secretion system lipoprotein TssJ [Gammaproteobacteria bacterium]